jgi:hypothetical protein
MHRNAALAEWQCDPGGADSSSKARPSPARSARKLTTGATASGVDWSARSSS